MFWAVASAEMIIQTALDLIKSKGLVKFSMRQLGRTLGVDAKAIYYYFPNKDKLMDTVLREAFFELKLPSVEKQPWHYRLHKLAKTYYTFLIANPELIPLMINLNGSIPATFYLVEEMILALEPTQLPPQTIVQILDLFWSFLPRIALDAASTTENQPGSLFTQAQQLSAEQFPAIQKLVSGITEHDLLNDLDLQIKILILVIEALIETDA